jgi:hypothetical protein
MTFFWDVAPCLLPPKSGLIAMMLETASASETSVNFYQTTGRNIQKTAIFCALQLSWILWNFRFRINSEIINPSDIWWDYLYDGSVHFETSSYTSQ